MQGEHGVSREGQRGEGRSARRSEDPRSRHPGHAMGLSPTRLLRHYLQVDDSTDVSPRHTALGAINEDGIASAVAALYRACRQTGLLRRPWKDMDHFIGLVSTADLGLFPLSSNTNASCAEQFRTASGVELAAYSKDRCDERGGNPRAPLPSQAQIEKRRIRVLKKAVYETASHTQSAHASDTQVQHAIKVLYEVAKDQRHDTHQMAAVPQVDLYRASRHTQNDP